MNDEICLKVIPIYNPKKEWIGNISINVKTLEIESNLLNGYTIILDKKGQ